MRKVYILTGPSGAGISSARFVFEELGFHIVENVPADLTSSLLESLRTSSTSPDNILLIASIHEARYIFDEIKKHEDIECHLVLLLCNKNELIKRFTLTRHIHPLTAKQSRPLEDAIDIDIMAADRIRDLASICVNTSTMSLANLRSHLYKVLTKGNDKISVTFISYGLKYGAPIGLDISFDVRIVPNPYWVEGLRELNGSDQRIKDYLLSYPITKELIDHIKDYLEFYLPNLSVKERKDYTVGICCSGGQHRSTFVANYLADYFKNKYDTTVIHRDCPELNKNE